MEFVHHTVKGEVMSIKCDTCRKKIIKVVHTVVGPDLANMDIELAHTIESSDYPFLEDVFACGECNKEPFPEPIADEILRILYAGNRSEYGEYGKDHFHEKQLMKTGQCADCTQHLEKYDDAVYESRIRAGLRKVLPPSVLGGIKVKEWERFFKLHWDNKFPDEYETGIIKDLSIDLYMSVEPDESLYSDDADWPKIVEKLQNFIDHSEVGDSHRWYTRRVYARDHFEVTEATLKRIEPQNSEAEWYDGSLRAEDDDFFLLHLYLYGMDIDVHRRCTTCDFVWVINISSLDYRNAWNDKRTIR
jgi:hypothetical protein